MKRNATAVWQGSLKDGAGILTSQSGVLSSTPYSFRTRFEDQPGTNPEELAAAAHAGCFTMQLSAFISEGGFLIGSIETKCDITLEAGTIASSHLTVKAKVDGISDDDFQALVKKAEENCPISKLFNTKITSEATLQ